MPSQTIRLIAWAIFCAGGLVQSATAATLVTYSLPASYQPSAAYSLSVNGTPVPVMTYHNHRGPEYHYAHFSFEGEIQIEVTATEPITDFRVRPLSYGLAGQAAGNKLIFKLDRPRYLMVNINQLQNLVILADPLEVDAPPPTGEGIRNVQQAPYGADATGTSKVTAILQHAIDDSHAAGGGIVYVPAGTYRTASLLMRSNVDLYLEGGALLLGTGDPADYVQCNPGSKSQAITTFIRFNEGDSQMRVRGRGMIDGNGEELYRHGGRKDPHSLRITLLRPNKNSQVTLEGVIVSHGTTWTVVPQQSDGIRIENLKLLNSEFGSENDGIDINSCQNVLVRHCFTYSNDDSLCAKPCVSGNFKSVIQGPDEEICDVVFDDIVVYGRCAGAKVGLQGSTPTTNVWFKNIEVLQGSRGIVIHHRQGSSDMDGIHFVNFNVENLIRRVYTPYPIQIQIEGPARGTFKVRNVVIDNVNFLKFGNGDSEDGFNGEPSRILGLSREATIVNMTIRNLRIAGRPILNPEDGRMNINEFVTGITFE